MWLLPTLVTFIFWGALWETRGPSRGRAHWRKYSWGYPSRRDVDLQGHDEEEEEVEDKSAMQSFFLVEILEKQEARKTQKA